MGIITYNGDLIIADNSEIGRKARLNLPNPNEEVNDYWTIPIFKTVSVVPIDSDKPCFKYSDIRFEYEKVVCSNGEYGWKLCKIRCTQNPKVKWVNVQDLIDKFESECIKGQKHE